MNKAALVIAMFAFPLAAFAQSADKTGSKAASQLAATLGDESAGKRSRTLSLEQLTQPKAQLPAARASDNLRVAEPSQITPGGGNKIENVEKLEAKSSRSAFQPVPGGSSSVRGARLTRPRRTQLAAFEPGPLRAGTVATKRTEEIARSWKSNLTWDVIIVDSYSATKGRSEADTQKVAQRAADDVRAYLVHRGVPEEYVVATGHVATAPKVEVSVTTCDDVTTPCRKPAAKQP